MKNKSLNYFKQLFNKKSSGEKKLDSFIESTKQLSDNISEGLIVYGPDMCYREWNPFMERLSGVKKEDVIGKHPKELFPHLVECGIIEKLDGILQGKPKNSKEYDFANKIKSGSVLDISEAIVDSKGKVIGILSLINDTTEERQSKKELKRLNRTLRMMTGCHKMLSKVENEKELINVACNKIVKRGGYGMAWIGYIDKENILPVAELGFEEGFLNSLKITTDENDSNNGKYPASHAIREGKPIVINDIHNNGNDTKFEGDKMKSLYGSTISLPLIGRDKQIIGVLNIYSKKSDAFNDEEVELLSELSRDLSRGIQENRIIEKNKDSDKLLEEKERQLQVRQRMDSLGTLASGIAHDFNNILFGITGYLELIKFSKELSEKNKKFLENSLKSTEKAVKLIRKLQNLSRRNTSKKTSIDIHSVITEVFSLLETTDKIIEKKIDVDKGQFYITGNNDELHQVLLNIGTNSFKAIEERGIKEGDFIKISAKDFRNNDNHINNFPVGDYVHITFEDNGKGMSEEVLKRAFDPWFSTYDKGVQKGQGLGLAMVYNIIKDHKGFISIDSEEGVGTKINIYLPKNLLKKLPKKIEETKETINKRKEKETILVIDDEKEIVNFVEEVLQMNNYEVITANNGKEGLDIFHLNKDYIDLVVLDLTMPKMSGQEVFEKMLEIKSDVKVIISSGQAVEEIREGILLQAKDFLKKPYSLKPFIEKVKTLLPKEN